MPIKVKLQRLTVTQAEKADDSQLFVLNKSNPRGNVNFVVVDSGQQKVSVQVPVTFIPVDLSTFATKADVLRNPNFRRLVARGFVHIVSSESAEEFLQDERAQKEHNRIFDVLKPPPANGLQRLGGGLGILVDDLVAGAMALVVLQLVVRLAF